jgi:hypothetical protein
MKIIQFLLETIEQSLNKDVLHNPSFFNTHTKFFIISLYFSMYRRQIYLLFNSNKYVVKSK